MYLFPAHLQDHIDRSHPEYSPHTARHHTIPNTPATVRHLESHWSHGIHGTALSRQSSALDSHFGPWNGPQCIQCPLRASALAFSLAKSASCKFRFVHETCTVRPRIVVPCCWLQILSSNGCHSLFGDSVILGHSPCPIHHHLRAILHQMVLRSFYKGPRICYMYSLLSPTDLRVSAFLP